MIFAKQFDRLVGWRLAAAQRHRSRPIVAAELPSVTLQ